jgi:hypothetical protein
MSMKTERLENFREVSHEEVVRMIARAHRARSDFIVDTLRGLWRRLRHPQRSPAAGAGRTATC